MGKSSMYPQRSTAKLSRVVTTAARQPQAIAKGEDRGTSPVHSTTLRRCQEISRGFTRLEGIRIFRSVGDEEENEDDWIGM